MARGSSWGCVRAAKHSRLPRSKTRIRLAGQLRFAPAPAELLQSLKGSVAFGWGPLRVRWRANACPPPPLRRDQTKARLDSSRNERCRRCRSGVEGNAAAPCALVCAERAAGGALGVPIAGSAAEWDRDCGCEGLAVA